MDAITLHNIARDFLSALPSGQLPDAILAPELTVWTVSSGASVDRARFEGAVALLAKISDSSIVYRITSLTAEDDRVIAEVESSGVLINGVAIDNHHVFIFTVKAGRITSMREYMNPVVVREKIVPLMQQLMATE